MVVIPFHSPWWSDIKFRGLMRLEDEALVVEFKVAREIKATDHGTPGREDGEQEEEEEDEDDEEDASLSFAESPLQELRILREELATASLERGWFADSLTLLATSVSVTELFPEAEDGQIAVRVDHKYRASARELVALISRAKADEPIGNFD